MDAGFGVMESHLGHNSLALEASAHAVVDTLWLSPARVDAHEAVSLVAVEARSACIEEKNLSATDVPLSPCRSLRLNHSAAVVVLLMSVPPLGLVHTVRNV